MSDQKRVLRQREGHQGKQEEEAAPAMQRAEGEAQAAAVAQAIHAADAARDDILRDYLPDSERAQVITAPTDRPRVREDDEAFVKVFQQQPGQ